MENKLKGDALVNKVALIVIEVINLALIFGYVSDYLTGTANLLYFVVFEVAAITTFFTVIIMYKKKPEKMRYVAFVCFAVVYFIGNIGAHVDVAFVMAFPIVVVFVLYYDYKLILTMAVTFSAICIVDIVYTVTVLKQQHSGLPINSSIILMELLGTVIYLITVTVVTRISNTNNQEKLETIQRVADKVNESIKGINIEINDLTKSSSAAKNAMSDINTGITNTAEAVSHQLSQTEAIQDRIENVSDIAGNISLNVDQTFDAVKEGKDDIANLVSKADISVNISDKVINDLGILQKNIDAMTSITKMIESIAFQTNLMALNANVEAAHAGEVGRGFAVVATEIANMATQTKKATSDISSLILNATNSLGELSNSITEMSQVIKEEREQTNQTSEVFETIQKSTDEVKLNVNNFMSYINGLTDANKQIVSSVQTISATTEEVTALANEAMIKEENNAKVVTNIATKISNLAKN